MPRTRTFALAAGLALALASPRSGRALERDDAAAASVLLSRFETVVFVSGELASRPLSRRHPSAGDVATANVAYAKGLLEAAAPGTAAALLSATSSVLLGARDFRAPAGTGVGDVRATMCFVFTLRPGATFDVASHLRAATRVDGTVPVWTWWAPPREGDPGPVLVHAAAAAAGTFVLGNGLDEVRAVAALLRGPAGREPFPEALAEQGLSGEPAWAYRRFRHREVVDAVAAGVTNVASSAEALVVIPSARAIAVRIVASRDGARGRPPAAPPGLPPFTQRKPGVWEATVPVASGDERASVTVLTVLSLLGFGVYL